MRRILTVGSRDRLAYQLRAKKYANVGADDHQFAELLIDCAVRNCNFEVFASLILVCKACLSVANASMLCKTANGMPMSDFCSRVLTVFKRCHVCSKPRCQYVVASNLCTGKRQIIGMCASCLEHRAVQAKHEDDRVLREPVYLHRLLGRIGSKVVDFDRRIGDPDLCVPIRCWRKNGAVTFIWTDKRIHCAAISHMNMKLVMRPALLQLKARDARHVRKAADIYVNVSEAIRDALVARGLSHSPYPTQCGNLFHNGVKWHANSLMRRLRPFLEGAPVHPATQFGDPTRAIIEECAMTQMYPVCGPLLFDPCHFALDAVDRVHRATSALEKGALVFKFLSVASWWLCGEKTVRIWQFAIHTPRVRIAVEEKHVEGLCGCSLQEACKNKVFKLAPTNAVRLVREWDIGREALSERLLRGFAGYTPNAMRSCAHANFHEVPKLNGLRYQLLCCSKCVSGLTKSTTCPLAQIQSSAPSSVT